MSSCRRMARSIVTGCLKIQGITAVKMGVAGNGLILMLLVSFALFLFLGRGMFWMFSIY